MSEQNYKEIWPFAMEQIHEEYKNNGQENEFVLWYKMEYLEDTLDTITVSVPSEFLWQRMLSKGNVKKVENKICEITGRSRISLSPKFNSMTIQPAASVVEEKPAKTKKEEPKEPEIQIQKEQIKPKNTNSTLNPNFTFENFVTGEEIGSKFAYNVCYAASLAPGEKTNPILIYGGVGLGKTHLMQAIGNEILKNSSEQKKICFIQTESFLNEFSSSIINKTTEKFKRKYRNLDVFLLDDIHFLNGKSGLQEELFYVFEALHKKKAQMVFTCDRPLNEIGNMTERLVSRLGSGACLDLHIPNFDTRKAIIHKKLENKDKALPEEIIDYIAKTVETNIRDLESALNKIIMYTEFVSPNITLEIVQQQLSNLYAAPGAGNVSIENIQKVVADAYNIKVEELKGKRRDKKYIIPRFIAVYITREMTEYAYTEIGNEFGGRDHTSIMNGYNKIVEKINSDPSLLQKIKNLMEEVKKYSK